MTSEVTNFEASQVPRRGRKRADASEQRAVSRLPSLKDCQCQIALEAPDVKAALHDYECAQAKRDSISRKLCGGSTAVTVDDLARWEEALSDAKRTLAEIARRTPILEQHPIFASVVTHS